MGIKERKKRNAFKMRQRILQAAMDLFARGGYENVSMRRIAKQIEYSPGAIYRYFDNKEDIMRQLCYQGFEQMLDFQKKIDQIPDPLKRLTEGCRCYIAFAMENQELYELMFATRQMEKRQDEGDDSVARESFQKLTEHVAKCLEQGIFSGQTPEALAVSIWASIHGLSSLLIKQQLRFLPEKEMEDTVQKVLSFFLRSN